MNEKEYQEYLCEKSIKRLIGYGIFSWKKANSYGLPSRKVKEIYKNVLRTIKYYC